MYQARKVVVFGSDGKTKIAVADIDGNENYRVELAVGTYVVDINHTGMDRSSDVPLRITIESGESVRVGISIDTGIR